MFIGFTKFNFELYFNLLFKKLTLVCQQQSQISSTKYHEQSFLANSARELILVKCISNGSIFAVLRRTQEGRPAKELWLLNHLRSQSGNWRRNFWHQGK